MLNLIIDTDVAHDDMYAILILLHAHVRGELKIHAFTTVTGVLPTQKGYITLQRLIKTLQLEIPVFMGCDKFFKGKGHLFTEAEWWNTWKDRALGFGDALKLEQYKMTQKVSEDDAVNYLLKKVNEDTKYTLVCLGPLTNIARAIEKCVECCKK